MPDSPYGPDKPCQRALCVEAHQFAAQDARARAIEAGDDPADVLANALPAVGDHLGGAHLDPADRARYDGIGTSYRAAPLSVRNAAGPLLVEVGSLSYRPAEHDSPMRAMIEAALDACFREIDRLRQQVAAVQVDADRRERRAADAALDCAEHGRQLIELGKQADAWARDRDRTEKARLVLLAEHQAIRDMLDAHDQGLTSEATHPKPLMTALRAMSNRTSAAHKRAWSDR